MHHQSLLPDGCACHNERISNICNFCDSMIHLWQCRIPSQNVDRSRPARARPFCVDFAVGSHSIESKSVYNTTGRWPGAASMWCYDDDPPAGIRRVADNESIEGSDCMMLRRQVQTRLLSKTVRQPGGSIARVIRLENCQISSLQLNNKGKNEIQQSSASTTQR